MFSEELLVKLIVFEVNLDFEILIWELLLIVKVLMMEWFVVFYLELLFNVMLNILFWKILLLIICF